PLVAAVPWEHVMVDDQSIAARPEQFGQPHLRWCPLCINMIELVVLGNRPTWRKCSDLRGHGLHFASKQNLALQELIARGAILRTFIGKGHAHQCLHQSASFGSVAPWQLSSPAGIGRRGQISEAHRIARIASHVAQNGRPCMRVPKLASMSALGQKRTCAAQKAMSALLPIAPAKANSRKNLYLLYL